jgi:hypothetical protein
MPAAPKRRISTLELKMAISTVENLQSAPQGSIIDEVKDDHIKKNRIC